MPDTTCQELLNHLKANKFSQTFWTSSGKILDDKELIEKLGSFKGSGFNDKAKEELLPLLKEVHPWLVSAQKELQENRFRMTKGLEKHAQVEHRVSEQCKMLGKMHPALTETPMETSDVKTPCSVDNFLENMAMFKWAGIGFGQQDSHQIHLSLRSLAASTPGLKKLRFWGKILGVKNDYFVAEGVIDGTGEADGTGGKADGLGVKNDFFVDEGRGTGANTFSYWVSTGTSAPWKQLPLVRPEHIIAARKVKHIMSGDLESDVLTMPLFPGKEKHFLRAQIARISSSSCLALSGFFCTDEEDKVQQDPDFEFPEHEELKNQDIWVHSHAFIHKNGCTTWPDPDCIEDQELRNKIECGREDEPPRGPLASIAEDQPAFEDGGCKDWRIKQVSDKGVHDFDGNTKSYICTVVKSKRWPGAITVAQGTKFANLYVGYGFKRCIIRTVQSGDIVYIRDRDYDDCYLQISATLAGEGCGISTGSTKATDAEFKIYRWSEKSGSISSIYSGDNVYIQHVTTNHYVEVSGNAAGEGYGISTCEEKKVDAEFKLYKLSGEEGLISSDDNVYIQAMTNKHYVGVNYEDEDEDDYELNIELRRRAGELRSWFKINSKTEEQDDDEQADHAEEDEPQEGEEEAEMDLVLKRREALVRQMEVVEKRLAQASRLMLDFERTAKMLQDHKTVEVVKKIFRDADSNGDGVISRQEMQRVLSKLAKWDEKEFDVLFQHADINKDGVLSYEEFCDWLWPEVKE